MLDSLAFPHPGAALLGLLLGIPAGSFLGTCAERFSYDDDEFDPAKGPRPDGKVRHSDLSDTSMLPWWERIPLFGPFLGMPVACRFELLGEPARCRDCSSVLGLHDRIPLWSFIRNQGRCSHCGGKIPAYLFWLELATPLALMIVLGVHGAGADGFLLALLACAGLVASTVDLNHQIIPDEVSLAALLVGLGAAFARTVLDPAWTATPRLPLLELLAGPALNGDGRLGWALAGAFSGALVLWILLKLGTWIAGTDAMGYGDIKLSAAIGTFLGPKANLLGLFFAAFFGAVAGLFILLAGGGRREQGFTKFAFGPYICIGAAVVALLGVDASVDLYLDSAASLTRQLKRFDEPDLY